MSKAMFKLVRFFLLTSAIAVAAIAIVVILHRQGEVGRLINFAERQNVALAQSFANILWPRFSSYVASASDLEANQLQTHPKMREIRNTVRKASAGLPVLKVKIYDLKGLTVYSSEPTEIGENKSDNPGYFAAARKGQPASKLTFRDAFSSFEGTVQERDLVESYLPIRKGNGPVEGVFELYTDVTPLLAEIKRDTVNIAVSFLLVFGLVYAILFSIVRRADRTIKRQYADITDKNTALEHEVGERKQVEAALQKAGDELEHRVVERTEELMIEISDRKQAEENLRKLSRAVEQSPATTIITDPAGHIEYVNPRFTEVTGYTLQEVAGNTPRVLKSTKTSPEAYQELWQTITAGKEWRGELRNRKKDGTLYWASTSISPITDQEGTITHFLGISEDITQRKRIEDEARRHRDELAHFGRVSIMGEMATSLAHELNQPLTVISGCAQLALDKLRVRGDKPEELRDPLEQAAAQAERANEIIRRVRNFIQKADQEREAINVNQTVQDVFSLLRSDAREHGVAIKLDLPDNLPTVMADPIQIQQVIINLAHNGIEVMSENPSTSRLLTIRTSKRRNATVEVAVHNLGETISPEHLQHVFDPFFTTKPDGLGMGLSISRTIIEAHGGTLWAESAPESGTVFRFTLPVTERNHPSHDS
jgi:PAS domain S-box-containing protein